MRARLARLWPRGLGGQLVLLLLGALAASQAISFFIYSDSQAEAVWQANRSGVIERTASVLQMLRAAPPGLRAELAAAAGTPRLRFWVTESSAAPEGTTVRSRAVMGELRQFLGDVPGRPRIAFIGDDAVARPVAALPPQPPPPADAREPGERRVRAFGPRPPWREPRQDLILSVALPDGLWLNARTEIRMAARDWEWPSAVSTTLMALAILAIVWFTARRATRPLDALAAGAEALGRGDPVAPLPEAGPREVRRLTAAFNRMRQRLTEYLADRTRMLGAIGHDLRTPIASLRLRAELVEDDDTREKMLTTLEDMQRMAEATLEVARDDGSGEPSRTVDLAALIGSLVDDLADMGKAVTFADSDRLVYACRPSALRRAIGNLIANAVQYGGAARVALADTPGGPQIAVDDDGPGIPEGRMEDVFKPFVRLEESRSRATGGAGLGLSIARSVALAHGGHLTLANRAGGGLRAEIQLPRHEA